MKTEIKLIRNQIEITEHLEDAYTVISGNVFIYLITLTEGNVSSRLFLKEARSGETIPSFYALDHFGKQFAFGIIAMDEAVLVREENSNNVSLQEDFYHQINIKIDDSASFSEKMFAIYLVNQQKVKNDFFQKEKINKDVQKKIDRLLNQMNDFGNNKSITLDIETSNEAIYDCAAILCQRKKIRLKPYTDIKCVSLKKIDIDEIARMSHFTTRKITLENQWYKQNIGDFLGFLPDDKPVVVIRKNNKYYLIDTIKKSETLVNSNFQIKNEAVEVYRSFDARSLDSIDILRFALDLLNKSDIIWYFILMLIVTVFGLIIPYLNQQLFDNYIPYGDSSIILGIGAVMLVCALGNILFIIVRNLLKFRTAKQIEISIQYAVFDRIFNLPEKFYRKYSSTDLTIRTNYISQIITVLVDQVFDSIVNVFFSLIYFFRMIEYSGKMAWVALFFVFVFVSFEIQIGLKQAKFQKEKNESDIEAARIITDYFTNIQQVRNSHIENQATYNYLKKYCNSKQKTLISDVLSKDSAIFSSTFSIAVTIVFYYMIVKSNVNITRGEFIAFLSAFGLFASSITQGVSVIITLNAIKPFIEKMKPIFETAPEYSNDNILPGKLKGGIDIKNVTFAYSEKEGNIIENLSLKINPGEYIGIVGPSGCGKSTLLKLLLGFEKPKTGVIFYDQMNIDQVDKRSLRKQIGVVLQDSGIIYGSIYDNIRITHPEATKDDVEQVIEQVQLKKDIEEMPMKLQTVLTPDSNTVSGGQKQRIMIARALVGNPSLLFFDEATSALDNITQKSIADNLKNMKITKVVIAHRLSTIRDCDRIIVMDHGKIIEEGKYEELMMNKGFFYNLASRQL